MMLGLRAMRTAALAAVLVAPLALNTSPAIAQSGADGAWEQILREKGVSRNATYNRRVERVAERILEAADQNPREWQFAVIDDDTPNAFALPGGQIGVHAGLFKVAKTDDELAAVIGHEVAHVTQEHGRQRMQRGTLLELGLGILGTAFDIDQNIARAAGMAATLGLVLPFSRDQEAQADDVGLRYMARAGYDPRAAVRVWQKFEDMGEAPPEFLATHPAPGHRATNLQELMPEVMETYRQRSRTIDVTRDEREWRLNLD